MLQMQILKIKNISVDSWLDFHTRKRLFTFYGKASSGRGILIWIREIGEIIFAIIYLADVVEKLLSFGYKMCVFLHLNG